MILFKVNKNTWAKKRDRFPWNGGGVYMFWDVTMREVYYIGSTCYFRRRMGEWFTQKKHQGTGIKELILDGMTFQVLFFPMPWPDAHFLELLLIQSLKSKYNVAKYQIRPMTLADLNAVSMSDGKGGRIYY